MPNHRLRTVSLPRGNLPGKSPVADIPLNKRFPFVPLQTKKSELIQYFRPDVGGPKLSTYHKLDLDEPKLMETILAESIGIKGEVKKHRHLFLHEQTRIHLDDVEGLGYYLEFEVVLTPEQSVEQGTEIANEMMKKFEIEEKDLIQGAYMDKLV